MGKMKKGEWWKEKRVLIPKWWVKGREVNDGRKKGS